MVQECSVHSSLWDRHRALLTSAKSPLIRSKSLNLLVDGPRKMMTLEELEYPLSF